MFDHSRFAKPISRRKFLQYSAATGTTLFLAGKLSLTNAQQNQNTLTLVGHQEVAGLGPNEIGPTVQAAVIYNILNPLLLYNHMIEIEPILMESYEVSDDALTYTFYLREGVQFHDGTTLTAEDVAYTYRYYSQDGQTIANRFLGMDSVEALDDLTVRVNMATPNVAFLAQAGEVPIVPAAYHADIGDDGFRTQPIGTGAYRLREWRPAEFTEIEAFPDHFRGPPNIQTLRLEVIPEASVRNIALLTGTAQSSVWPLLVEDSLSYQDSDDFRLMRTIANSLRMMPLNNERPQLQDVRVRRALLHALDRQRIIDDLWNGVAVVAHSNLTPKNAFYFNPNVRQYAYDPAEARRLLDEAGFEEGADGIRVRDDGVRMSFTCTTISGDQARRPIAELAQQLFRQVGVEMLLAEAPVAGILEGLVTGRLESSLFNAVYGSTPEPDPSSTLRSNGGSNYSRYSNPEMDRLIDEGIRTVDLEARRAIYYRIQEIVAEDVPFLFLHFDEWMNVWSNDVQGLPDEVLNADPLYFNAHRLRLGS